MSPGDWVEVADGPRESACGRIVEMVGPVARVVLSEDGLEQDWIYVESLCLTDEKAVRFVWDVKRTFRR